MSFDSSVFMSIGSSLSRSLSKSQKAKAVAEKKRVGMGRRTSSIKKRKSTRKKKK